MSFDWGDYLRLSRELCAPPLSSTNTEAKQRSAISRAYYSAFGRSRMHLRQKDQDRSIPVGPEAHDYVRRKFESSGSRTRRRIGANLGRLRDERNKADYNEIVPGLTAMSALALRLAGQVLEDLGSL